MRFSSVLAIAIATFTGADAFWRLPCAAPLVTERADPIVNPGKVAGHVHTIMGGNGFGFDMNYASTQASTCSSCRVMKDMSNYWTPTLYHKNDNGTFTSVPQIGGGLIYYLQRSDPQDPEYSKGLLAFPEGFQMLAGNPFLRSFSPTLEQRAINYACLGESGPETNHLPKRNCKYGVRSQVFFPSCWDGKNLDSPDHKSHMAYPDRVDSGKCPASHPKRFISLFYEITWDTNSFNPRFVNGKQPFVFSNGDETGYGFHGDFVNGWDVALLQRAVTQCTANSGNVEDCPVFQLYSNDFSNSCKIPTSVDEQTQGTLVKLPGCNPPTGEGANAVKPATCDATTAISPPSNPFVDLTSSKKFKYIGCGKDNIGGRTLTGARFEQKDMTNEKCVDLCSARGFNIAGTEYSTECYCGNSVPADRAPVNGLMGDCFMPCSGNEDEFCGGAGTISLYQKCSGTCENISFGANKAIVAAPAPAQNVKAPAAPADPAPIVSVSASSATFVKPATTPVKNQVGAAPTKTIAPKCAGPFTVTIAATTITVTERADPTGSSKNVKRDIKGKRLENGHGRFHHSYQPRVL